jgi:hypothetical protein
MLAGGTVDRVNWNLAADSKGHRPNNEIRVSPYPSPRAITARGLPLLRARVAGRPDVASVRLRALVAAAFNAEQMLSGVANDNFRDMFITWVPGTLFIGIGALLLFTLLSNFKRPPVPRGLALAIAVVVASVIVRYLEARALNSGASSCEWGCVAFKVRWSWLYWGMAAAAWYFIERTARRLAALREAELDRSRLETQMIEARLQVMQAQVEPHFLFNTLAHVKWLYQTDPARGRRMLRSFRGYLRAALPQMRGTRSTLGREIELARAYLDTQLTRMGRRLRFGTEIPTELLSAAFPPMMLLSLVENAIKHGLNPLPEGGRIDVRAGRIGETLQLVVADTGAGLVIKGRGGGSGIGLSNIRARLAALYGHAARLTLESNTPRGVVARIELPLQSVRTSDGEPREPHAEAVARASRIPA